jgi:hypothetical protein
MKALFGKTGLTRGEIEGLLGIRLQVPKLQSDRSNSFCADYLNFHFLFRWRNRTKNGESALHVLRHAYSRPSLVRA